MRNNLPHFKNPIFIGASFLAFLLVLGLYIWLGRGKISNQNFVSAKRATVIETVSATGRVRAAEDIDLGFEKPGRIGRVNVRVGDKVFPGQILVSLENGDIAAQLDGAQANVNAQQAKLDELKKGTRPEELNLTQTKVDAARQSVRDLETGLREAVKSAYTTGDDAVRNKVDQMFSNAQSSQPQLNFNSSFKSDLESGRLSIETFLINWQSLLPSINPLSDSAVIVSSAKQNLQRVEDFLDKVSLAVNALNATSQLSQTVIDSWKLAVSAARANVNASIANISLLNSGLNSAKSVLAVAESELVLKQAGATLESVKAQSAAVDSAKANLEMVRSQLVKTIIRAPIEGVITRKNVEVGEIVNQNAPAVSMISSASFEIETNVSEADVAKIKTADKTLVTLDAYGNNITFPAQVVSVDPAATVNQGVSNYRVVIQFVPLEKDSLTGAAKVDERVRAGMTANISIVTATKENVIVIPQTAVIQRGRDQVVLIKTGNGSTAERKIQSGIHGQDGLVEVLSGLSEGDPVVSFGQPY